MKSFSIIIPVYNTNMEYLKYCLSSCANQKYDKYEIILIDDGSTIDYSSLLKEYDNIRYIKSSKHGVSFARNIGIAVAKNEYLVFVDSDDVLDEMALYHFNNGLKNNEDIIISAFAINGNNDISSSLEVSKIKRMDCINSLLAGQGKVPGAETVWAKAYKRNAIIKHNLLFENNLSNFEDVLFNFKAYNIFDSVVATSIRTYNYRVNEDSTCCNFQKYLLENSLSIINYMQEFMKSSNIRDIDIDIFIMRNVIRLFRKYYPYIMNTEYYDQDIQLLLQNKNVLYCIKKNIEREIDYYKKCLYILISEDNHQGIRNYIENVCQKKLLKK